MKQQITLLLALFTCLLFSVQNLEAQCDASATGGILNCINTSVQLDGSTTAPNPSFAWSGPAGFSSTMEDPVVSVPGAYTLTVTNGAGCSATATAEVLLDALPPVLIVGNVVPLSCINTTTTLNITATPPGATFAWSGPAGFTSNLQNPTVSSPGNYTVTATLPSSGCTSVSSVLVTGDFDEPFWTCTVTPPTSCNGSDGSLICSFSGNYQFLWSNGATGPSIYNLPPGTYCVTVEDNDNGCTKTECYSVSDPSGLTIGQVNVTPIKCKGGADGTITITVSGGTPPYTYLWYGPQGFTSTQQNLTNLKSGNFFVLITDANGCNLSSPFILVPEPASFVSIPTASIQVENITCTGGNDGSINLAAMGGTPPYNYSWKGPGSFTANQAPISNLKPGQYSVTVTDSNGCTFLSNGIVVTEPTPPFFYVATVPCDPANEPVDLTFTFTGIPPFTMDIAGPVSTNFTTSNNPHTITLPGFPGGTYTFTFTDSDPNSTCTPKQTITIVTPPPLSVDLELDGNGCDFGLITAEVTGSLFPISYLWNPIQSTSNLLTINQSGTYSVTVTDANGCTATASEYFEIFAGNCGSIQGKVFDDNDFNCLNANDLGLGGWLVVAAGQDTFYAVSDPFGFFDIRVFPGVYEVTTVLPSSAWALCQPSFQVNVPTPDDTTWINIPVQPVQNCYDLEVEISAGNLRRCFSGNTIHLDYCNHGTIPATDAYILVELDPLLEPLSATQPYISLGNNVLQFNLGTVDAGECGNFALDTRVSCNAILGQTLCYSAGIFPDSGCLKPSPLWSGAHVDIAAECSADSLRFKVKNTGTGDMTSTLEYVVIEDGVMLRTGSAPPLKKDEEMTVSVPADGSTFRLQVKQEPFHPGLSEPSHTVEGCTVNASFSTGFVNILPFDEKDANRAQECSTVVGAFDPNDKNGYPLGYGPQHFIEPGTDIEYQIRFQNTGTDTAFTVVIRDTISAWLDVRSIRNVIASHPVRTDIYGEGILKFTFENILLPDSNVNETASHGFAKFRISQRPDVPLGTDIRNAAGIYFDFNDPIVTNTTTHRVGKDFIPVKTWQPARPEFGLRVSPNPFSDATLLEISGLRSGEELVLKIFDLHGLLLREEKAVAPSVSLRRDGLPEGIYFLKIENSEGAIGVGKIVVR